MELRDLKGDVAPSAALRGRLVGELAARGLLRRRSRAPWRDLAAAAAVVLALAAGYTLGKRTVVATEAPTQADFALMLYESRAYQPAARPGERTAEYGRWARAQGGLVVFGAELDSEERSLGAAGGDVGEALTGFFLIRAASWEEAIMAAERSPHVRYGGRVAVRRLRG